MSSPARSLSTAADWSQARRRRRRRDGLSLSLRSLRTGLVGLGCSLLARSFARSLDALSAPFLSHSVTLSHCLADWIPSATVPSSPRSPSALPHPTSLSIEWMRSDDEARGDGAPSL